MITSTGVGSGLDVNSIVTSLMALEQRPLTQLQKAEATIQTRISAFGNLKSQLANLGDVAARLATATSWNPLRVDSTDSNVVTATATTAAAAGKHTLEVSQLAQGQVLASGPYAASSTVVGNGSLTLEVGTTDSGVFTPRSGNSPVTITIGADKQTLADVRDAINAAKAGVTASIVTGPSGAQLVLRTADGAQNSVRLTATDADGNNTDTAGLSALAFDPAAASASGKNLTQTQAAQDAKFKLDGVDLTSATNSPSTVLEGVTLNLKKATTAPVDFTVAVETMAVRKNVNDFVQAYNSLNTLLKQQTQADPSGKTRGTLQADSTAVSLLGALRTMLRGEVTGAGTPDSLNAAGLELKQDGSLAIDEKRFGPLLENPSQLAKLFSQAKSGADENSRGFGLRFKEWSQALTGDTGALSTRIEGLKDSAESNQKQQDRQEERLVRVEARLRAQYQRLDTQMSSLNGQMAQMMNALGLG